MQEMESQVIEANRRTALAEERVSNLYNDILSLVLKGSQLLLKNDNLIKISHVVFDDVTRRPSR